MEVDENAVYEGEFGAACTKLHLAAAADIRLGAIAAAKGFPNASRGHVNQAKMYLNAIRLLLDQDLYDPDLMLDYGPTIYKNPT